jgi:hypothetical protein
MLALITLPYARPRWSGLLRQLFEDYQENAVPLEIQFPAGGLADSIHQLGVVTIQGNEEGETLALAVIEISARDTVELLRNRVGIRNFAARLLAPGTADGLLIATIQPGNDSWRFTFVHRETRFTEDGDLERIETPTRRFTYVLGPDESCRTPDSRFQLLARHRGATTLAQVLDAFSVEKLSDEFFTTYKEHYKQFCAHLIENTNLAHVLGIELTGLEGKERDRALKPLRDFVKKLLGRLVFLHFIQKKGWLGCPVLSGAAATLPQESMPWVDGRPDFLREMFQSAPPAEQASFHSSRLVPLFFQTLNAPGREGLVFAITGNRVPYLNGGLFEPDFPGVEGVDFPAPLFAALLEFFRQYHFTIDENDPEDHEIGIDPEMLGRIFENLLEDNKDKGAYYTPKPVVQYMCQQSLIHALTGRYAGDVDAPAEIERLVRLKEPLNAMANSWLARHATDLSAHLDDLRICDPAIGSGAFPIGLLQEIYWTKLTLNPSLDRAHAKRGIIQHCIHGVDLDAGAVEIARLRFWLALIVDESVPTPLPNLDYQIMQGNSLLESFEGERLDQLAEPVRAAGRQRLGSDVMELDLGGSAAPGELTVTIFTPAQHNFSELREEYYACHDPAEKAALRARIDAAVLQAIDARFTLRREELVTSLRVIDAMAERKHLRGGDKKLATMQAELDALAGKSTRLRTLLENPRSERPFFLWHLWFRQILADAPEGRGGFDIVIANPPYVRHESISDWKTDFQRDYEAFDSTADLYVYFMEAGVRLLRDGGILNFITSNSFLRTGYGKPLRQVLKKHSAILSIVDFGGVPVFDSAKDTYVCIPLIAKSLKQERVAVCQIPSFGIQDLSAHVAANRFTIPHERLTDEAWSLKPEAQANLFEKITNAGKPLGDYVERKLFYGIKTGLNEAFELTASQQAAIMAKSPASSVLIKPFLGGQDIRRYYIEDNQRFLIVIPCGWTRKQLANGSNGESTFTEQQAFDWLSHEHPLIAQHLQKFLVPLKKRQDQGNYWWELRACDYYDHLDAPKIIFPDICKAPRFALDRTGIYLSNTAYCLGSDSLYLLGILNSSLFWYAIANISIPFGVRAGQYRYRLIYQYMEKVPIRVIDFSNPADKDAHDAIETLVDSILTAKRAGDEATVKELEGRIDRHVFRLYGLTPEEIALVRGASA